MQTLYITNIFFFLVEQYFIDTLESILKLSQGFWNNVFSSIKFWNREVRRLLEDGAS